MENKKRSYNEISGSKTSAPFVSVDGIRFFSDRFYLSAPTGLAGYKPFEESSIESDRCSCQDPPPLIDIVKLVNSLDLEAVVIATYSIDLNWMQTSLPKLFTMLGTNSSSNVPTLVLHGSKGFHKSTKGIQVERNESNAESEKDSDVSILHMNNFYLDKLRNDQSHQSILHEKIDVIEINDSSDDDAEIKSEMNTGKLEFLDENVNPNDDINSLSEILYMTEVLSTYVPAISSVKSMIPGSIHKNQKFTSKKEIIVIDSSDEETEIDSIISANYKIGISEEIITKRIHVNGVHHPKYFLLFEKRGSVVIVVSTANLTSPKSVDGIWLQRFERRCETEKEPSVDEVLSKYDGSDFGYVLTDLLLKQSEAAEASCMIPEQFLKKYLSGFRFLSDLPKMYRFDEAQVHLITTVPGFHTDAFTTGHLSSYPHNSLGYKVHYGPQRVADILYKLSEKPSSSLSTQSQTPRPWLPQNLLSDRDKLIIQTTSIGSKWSSVELEDLISQYMGGRVKDDPLQVVDVIWPSMEYATRAVDAYSKFCPGPVDSFSNFCFFSSSSFNESDLSCLQRLKRYETSTPAMVNIPILPHIKSFARLLDGTNVEQDHLAWLMLTSACLSKGAQGFSEKQKLKGFEDEIRGYSNFEVGVLFVSRCRGDQFDRKYSCFPTKCHCNSCKNVQDFTIPLPIPYNIRPPPFQNDSDREDFCETPFFHQITKHSMIHGKCLLTPYGKFLSENLARS